MATLAVGLRWVAWDPCQTGTSPHRFNAHHSAHASREGYLGRLCGGCSMHRAATLFLLQVEHVRALPPAPKAARVAAAIRTAQFMERWRADMETRSGRLRALEMHW